MKYFNDNIYYLQRNDFDDDGNIINKKIPKNKFAMIMIQANFCGYCEMAKPDYKKFADKNKDILCLTIQADGKEKGEKELESILTKIDDSFEGYPHYVVYKEGKKIATYTGDRSFDSLNKFIKDLKLKYKN